MFLKHFTLTIFCKLMLHGPASHFALPLLTHSQQRCGRHSTQICANTKGLQDQPSSKVVT